MIHQQRMVIQNLKWDFTPDNQIVLVESLRLNFGHKLRNTDCYRIDPENSAETLVMLELQGSLCFYIFHREKRQRPHSDSSFCHGQKNSDGFFYQGSGFPMCAASWCWPWMVKSSGAVLCVRISTINLQQGTLALAIWGRWAQGKKNSAVHNHSVGTLEVIPIIPFIRSNSLFNNHD